MLSQAVAVACVYVPSQFTTLTYISYLSIPSTLAIITAIILIIVELFQMQTGSFGANTTVGVVWDNNVDGAKAFFSFYVSFSSFVFAYQGQDMFVEIMHEMKDQREAAKAVTTSYMVMTACYLITTILAYGAAGKGLPGYLPDVMPPGGMRTGTNIVSACRARLVPAAASADGHGVVV